MAPFCVVDVPIPFPCLPPPRSPKIDVLLRTTLIGRRGGGGGGGVRELWHLKGMK